VQVPAAPCVLTDTNTTRTQSTHSQSHMPNTRMMSVKRNVSMKCRNSRSYGTPCEANTCEQTQQAAHTLETTSAWRHKSVCSQHAHSPADLTSTSTSTSTSTAHHKESRHKEYMPWPAAPTQQARTPPTPHTSSQAVHCACNIGSVLGHCAITPLLLLLLLQLCNQVECQAAQSRGHTDA